MSDGANGLRGFHRYLLVPAGYPVHPKVAIWPYYPMAWWCTVATPPALPVVGSGMLHVRASHIGLRLHIYAAARPNRASATSFILASRPRRASRSIADSPAKVYMVRAVFKNERASGSAPLPQEDLLQN
jgi:hypothetical protein